MACDEVVVAVVGDEAKRRATTTTMMLPETLASDGLLFATMSVVGLPVEVQVRDGSLFSGVFHTASLDKGFGVVLKKARKIGTGKYDSNIALGDFVDTLVVKAGDLVQVVVKEFLFPAEGIGANKSGGGVNATAGIAATQNCNEDVKLEAKSFTSDAVYSAGKLDQNERERFFCNLIKTEDAKVSEELGVPVRQSESTNQMRNDMQDSKCLEKAEVPSSVSKNAVMGRQVGKYNTKESSDHIYETGHEVHHLKPSSCCSKSSEALNPKKNLLGKFGAKESKLNPNAEVFSPSYANLKSAAAAVPVVLNQTYFSNSIPAMPNGYLPSAFEVNHFPSRKMVPYNNLVPGNSTIGTHFARPVAGHATGMLEPVRVAGDGCASWSICLYASCFTGCDSRKHYLTRIAPSYIESVSTKYAKASRYRASIVCDPTAFNWRKPASDGAESHTFLAALPGNPAYRSSQRKWHFYWVVPVKLIRKELGCFFPHAVFVRHACMHLFAIGVVL